MVYVNFLTFMTVDKLYIIEPIKWDYNKQN